MDNNILSEFKKSLMSEETWNSKDSSLIRSALIYLILILKENERVGDHQDKKFWI